MKRLMTEGMAVFTLAVILVGIGMAPIVMPWVKKPADRVFNGMHGYLDDYVGYVSYVKEGMYGLNTFRIRSLPKGQSPTSANLVYVWSGKVAAPFGLDAPTIYHGTRALLGLALIVATYMLFRITLRSPFLSFLATILAFTSTSLATYVFQDGRWVYTPLSTFSFIDNVAGRVTTRLHYQLGAILFLIIVTTLIRGKNHKNIQNPHSIFHIPSVPHILKVFSPIRNFVLHYSYVVHIPFILLSFLLGITHPSFAILLMLTIGLLGVVYALPVRSRRQRLPWYGSVLGGLLIGILLSKWSTSVEPYVSILAFEEYVYYERLSLATIVNDLKTFGPVLWIGGPGLLYAVVRTNGKSEKDLLMFFWMVGHLVLFFSLYSLFRAERFRFIQSLYFIPMAYGTIMVLGDISRRVGTWFAIAGTGALVLMAIPSYVNGFQTDYYYNTDYRSWSTLIFPTIGQLEAYRFLDAHTEKESVVVASFEAANNIIIYSHNYVIGNTQGWPKAPQTVMVRERDNFFSGMMKEEDAKSYLKKHDIRYIYNGWQERTLGDVTKYPFLSKVFSNSEVQIYKAVTP